MKKLLLLSLVVIGSFNHAGWAAGRGGGGGGGFHGGGFGGGGFHGGGFGGGGFRGGGFSGGHAFGGGARFGAPGRSFGGPQFAPQSRLLTPAFRNPGFRASGVSGMTRTGTNIPHRALQAPDQNGIAAARPRATAPSTAPRLGLAQGRDGVPGRQQVATGQRGPRGFTGRIAERQEGNWHPHWDHGRPHYNHGRFYVFDNGYWWGLEDGQYPWDYYPYYTYDYYPYDYYVDSPDSVPANYQGTSTTAPSADPRVVNVQTQLAQQGYYGGPIDGLFGPTTRDALARYQTSKGLRVTGSLTPDTLQSFGLPTQVATN